MSKTKKLPERPVLIPLEDLVDEIEQIVGDATYEASKNTKNPALKRRKQRTLNVWYSIHLYLNELKKKQDEKQ